jgi:predicted nucleotidyltransferase
MRRVPETEPVVSEERRTEVERLLSRARDWATRRPDVVAVALVGSWAYGNARLDSDVDLVVLTTDKPAYLRGDSWLAELGGASIIRTRDWGPLYTERRFVLPSGLEVELGVAPPEWASADPPDPSICAHIRDGGLVVLHDPDGVLARLIAACQPAR